MGCVDDYKDVKLFALKVRLCRLVEAINDCNALDMGRDVSIKLELWEAVQKEIEDCEAILRNK